MSDKRTPLTDEQRAIYKQAEEDGKAFYSLTEEEQQKYGSDFGGKQGELMFKIDDTYFYMYDNPFN